MSEDTTPEVAAAETAPLRHGHYATYANHNCRCGLCREAHNRWHREYRQTENGKKRTTLANRKSRRIQQAAAFYIKENMPEVYANIVESVNNELNEGTDQ